MKKWDYDKLKQTDKNLVNAFIISAIGNAIVWYGLLGVLNSLFGWFFYFLWFAFWTTIIAGAIQAGINTRHAIENVANRKDSSENVAGKETPLDILKKVFAEGKISEKEFKKKKELLK